MTDHPSRPQPAGHLAVPDDGRGPGVLVLHAWWGLAQPIQDLCDRLAAEGFVAFAPDMFGGRVARTIEEAEALSRAMEEAGVEPAISDGLAFLRERAAVGDKGIGVVGFSFGGYYALKLSAEHPDVARAVVLFYGSGDWPLEGSRADYSGHFGTADPYEPEENVAWVESAIEEAGRPVTFHRYEGAGHWFFEPDREGYYDPAAAELAWQRTLSFLKDRLE